MHRAHTTQSPVIVPSSASSDSPTRGAQNVPLPLHTNSPSRDKVEGLPSTSQSWPTPSDLPPQYPSLSAVGEELVSEVSEDSFESFDCSTDVPWSPAAAFLSSFSPASSVTITESIPGYVLGSTIGHGGFSVIKIATSPSGGTVAVKIVRHSAFASLSPTAKAKQRARLSREARIWVTLSHENILPLFDSHRSSEATYLITLYCPAGSLLDILRREGTPALEQTDVGCMFRQIVKALQYLHESVGLVHGDVKLENVLVDECGVCRLSDFGLARHIGGDSSQVSSASEEDDDAEFAKFKGKRGRRTGTDALPVHLSLLRHGPQRHRNSEPIPASSTPPTHPDHMFLPGSLPYAAPELLLPHSHSAESLVDGHGSRPVAHPAQDMWALGVLLYTLLTGALPFRDSFEPRLQMKILRGTYDMPPGIGESAESVLKGCLRRNVGERWTISKVDNAAWGIGYGVVEIDPVLRQEQHSQSEERLVPTPSEDELTRTLSSWSIVSDPSAGNSALGGCLPLLTVRSQSRSPSPSIAPRTPEDDEGSTGFFDIQRRRRRVPLEEDDVQIVRQGEGADWDSRDRVFDEASVDAEDETQDLPLRSDDLGDKKWPETARGRQEAPRDYDGDRKKSQSRTRSWTLDDLVRPRMHSRNR